MTLNESEIKLHQILKDIPAVKTSKRIDCPNCGGKSTLSITNLGTIILFYCFRAACNLKGKQSVDIGIEDLRGEFTDGKKDNTKEFDLDNFLFLPEITGRGRIENYLHKSNCWEAYREGRADIRWDPYEDRVVFMIYSLDSGGVPIGACGRSLTKRLPKWKRYGKESIPFMCLTDLEEITNTLIIVEDCASACAASSYCDSAALLGTFLQANYLKEFLPYDSFILALDKDASKLAFKMQRELQFYRPTKILLLEEDLKALNPDEIKRLFDV